MFNIKEIIVQIIQSVKLFAIIDKVNGINVYNYEGKNVA